MSEADGIEGEPGPRPSTFRGERRWPMALAVLVAAILQIIVPIGAGSLVWFVFPVLRDRHCSRASSSPIRGGSTSGPRRFAAPRSS